ncbi:hypothetical protein [Candidatus Enterococcus murrayae]|uniref:Uncharacterized protein n=1 Tax=Candidatus Enterococcus murrayae TaxID=2815321 RepID=A0ABS3HEL4_9ENTE|nr:hypothetical protein [Enterococcus sp. MJM16]MBO0451442.1 hypothetical protein [Enterococcus sp. MJM16]
MTQLVGTFKNGENKTHRWSFGEWRSDQSPRVIQQELERLTELAILDEAGIEIFKTVVAAAFVQTTETVIFGLESEPREEDTEDELQQTIEELLPKEAKGQKLTLTEQIDLLFTHQPSGSRLKGFRFEALEDFQIEESDGQLQVILRRSPNDLL